MPVVRAPSQHRAGRQVGAPVTPTWCCCCCCVGSLVAASVALPLVLHHAAPRPGSPRHAGPVADQNPAPTSAGVSRNRRSAMIILAALTPVLATLVLVAAQLSEAGLVTAGAVFVVIATVAYRGAGLPWRRAWIAPVIIVLGLIIVMTLELIVLFTGLAELPREWAIGYLPWIAYAIALPILVAVIIQAVHRSRQRQSHDADRDPA